LGIYEEEKIERVVGRDTSAEAGMLCVCTLIPGL
jgi:hypothetical protein